MTLKIIKCEESTISCFLRKVKDEEYGSLSSIEDCRRNSKSSIVLGKIIKFIDTKPEEKCVKILVREILPDSTYGMKFKAVIKDTLALRVISTGLRTGDRLGFFEPWVFSNPSFESSEDLQYILQIGSNKQSVMWYAKKQYVLAQPATSKETNSNESDDTSTRGSSVDTRQKPQIHLPVNPQIPSNTQKLNPRYVYKNLAQVKSDALLGDLRRVNIYAVVSEVSKGLSKTSTGKYTIICKIVDDSAGVGELINFDLHFFTSEPTILSNIEQGDILRLHRVKMELFKSDVDGRIFNSQDVVLFKKDSPNLTPISCIKNLTLTDEDKRNIQNLKKWYKEEYGSCLRSVLTNITLLSNIQDEGEYNLVCKVVSTPIIEDSRITLSVSDGSVMMHKAPHKSCHIPSQYDLSGVSQGHLVTDIEVFERLDDYSKIKVNDYVFFRSVMAIKTPELQLSISTFPFPIILEAKLDKVLDIESYLKEWESKIQSVNNNKRFENDDDDDIQEVQVIHPVSGKDDTEQVSDKPQVSNQEKVTKRSTRSQTNQQITSNAPVVKLTRLNNEKLTATGKQEENKRKKSVDKKDFDVLEDDPEDASTVVNLTLDSEVNRQTNKKIRLDMDLSSRSSKNQADGNMSSSRETVAHKVTSWLTQHETKDNEDLDMSSVRQLLINQDSQEAVDLSSFISSNIRRMQVFLIQVIPNPIKEPLDLVSGYCIDGCQQLFLYSTICWKEVDSRPTPFCPSCQKTSMEMKLILIFMLQLNVMDRNGNRDSVVVCREHGETLFGCSVREFVTDLAIRRSRVQLLMDNTILQHSRPGPVSFPLLDLSIVAINNTLCAVNTKLKLPPNP